MKPVLRSRGPIRLNEFGVACRRCQTDRFRFHPKDRPRMTRQSLGTRAIDLRRWEAREAEKRGQRSSDGRTRHRWSGTKAPRLAEAAKVEVLQTERCSP